METTNLSHCGKQTGDAFRSAEKAFYLVEKGTNRLLVMVTDVFMEVRRMEQDAPCDRFCMGGWSFVKCNYELTI